MRHAIAYGPVPSRRLGQSLGVNNIPPKICTYSCIYCQLGRTLEMQVKREEFYPVKEVFNSVIEKVETAEKNEEPIDYISFVPDGEPTLDKGLGEKIDSIKELGYNIAVISNASLIWDEQVREELSKADWVSVKMDAVSTDIWKSINRPHKDLDLEKILNGILKFSKKYSGELNTETMMVEGVNDDSDELEKIAGTIVDIDVDTSYISIPTRPPAEKWVNQPDERKITEAYNIFKDKGIDVEYLIGYEGDTFASSGDIKKDLLSITAVHPMRRRQVDKLLSRSDAEWDLVQELLDSGLLIETEFKDEKYYMRKLS